MSGDHRFDSMHTAPIFKQSKKDSFKVKVDDRFKSVLSDTRFQSVPGKVDKYGRKTKTKDGANKVVKELKEFYDIDGDDNETAVPEHQQTSNKPSKPHGGSMDSRLDYLNKLARGEISEESSSDDSSEAEDESESSDESDQSDDDLVAQQQGSSSRKSALAIPEQPEPELSADVSSTRVAIQNCDWENLSAEDIMVVMQSFCPPGSGSSVRKVTVYVSDFGKKRMEAEARYGPQGIWKAPELLQEEEDDNDDLYDQIADVDGDSSGSDEEEEGEGSEEEDGSEGSQSGSEGSESEASSVPANKRGGKQAASMNKKALKGADFVRKNGAVGLVLHTDMKSRGLSSRYKAEGSDSEGSDSGSEASNNSEEEGEDGGASKKAKPAKKLKDGEGFDDVALRKYELSKLRYYFAVAECDSARTANRLYEELDGVEMEASSMVFDLSLVPQELSFEDREVRDAYSASASGAVNPSYKPPDFVVNALQHTKVQCSWDEGEKLRERHLSNFSSWRNLNESELQQYVADSASSDDDDDEEGESEDSDSSAAMEKKLKAKKPKKKKVAQKKQQKASSMRKLLLGDDDSQDSEGGEGEDDFFAKEGDVEDSGDGMYGSDSDVPEGFASGDDEDEEDEDEGESGENKTLTYIPELGKDLLAKKRGGAEETPYEAEQRKMAEKKKARKVAKKAYQEQLEAEKKAAVAAAKKPASSGRKGKATTAQEVKPSAEELKRKAELELLFDEGEGGEQHAEEDYDMRELVLAEREKARGKKSKRRKGTASDPAAAGEAFKLDMSDARFSKLFEGDARFGIDKTSTEFRPTPASKEILSEQAKRRAVQERQRATNNPAPETSAVSAAGGGSSASREEGEAKPVDVDNLVSKLKRKYAKA